MGKRGNFRCYRRQIVEKARNFQGSTERQLDLAQTFRQRCEVLRCLSPWSAALTVSELGERAAVCDFRAASGHSSAKAWPFEACWKSCAACCCLFQSERRSASGQVCPPAALEFLERAGRAQAGLESPCPSRARRHSTFSLLTIKIAQHVSRHLLLVAYMLLDSTSTCTHTILLHTTRTHPRIPTIDNYRRNPSISSKWLPSRRSPPPSWQACMDAPTHRTLRSDAYTSRSPP